MSKLFNQPNYTLSAYTGILQGRSFVSDLTPVARSWRHTTRLQGGFWEGSFELTGPEAQLQEVFYGWLGNHIEERAGGGISWEGMVYALELELAGSRWRRGFEELGFANYVSADYTDTSGVAQTTAAASDAESIKRYGRYEQILTAPEGQYPAATAQSRRDRYLQLFANAPILPVSINLDNADDQSQDQIMGARQAKVTVQVCGYVFTAQWRYVTTNDDGTGNISTWIDSLITTDCEFLSSTQITTNTLQVKRTLSGSARTWDTIQGLVSQGDGTSVYTIKVIPGRGVVYAPLDTSPLYYVVKNRVYQKIGAKQTVNPWMIQPGIWRIQDYPIGGVPLDGSTIYADQRDVLVEEVEVSQDGNVTPKTAGFSESSLLAGWANG